MNTRCPGCLLELPEEEGPTHAYVTTSAACWRLFAETMSAVSERLFTDAYMVQHPTGDDPRQIQSVAVHLITLNASLELDQPMQRTSEITAAAVTLGRTLGGYPPLIPPESWTVTVADVALEEITGCQYVEEVWNSWRSSGLGGVPDWTTSTLKLLDS